jgi:hypothetical protein
MFTDKSFLSYLNYMRIVQRIASGLLVLAVPLVSVQAQDVASSGVDSIYSMSGKFKRSEISIATDSFIDYRIEGDFKNKISENVYSVEKVKVGKQNCYRVTSVNIPVASNNVTTVEALIDYNDLHLIDMRLSARTDSGYVAFSRDRFKGWSQLPKEERKVFDFRYDRSALLPATNAPWLPGLLLRSASGRFALPYFAMFRNEVNWKVYNPLEKEDVVIHDKVYHCTKVDAGPIGPPGYTSFQWFDKKGRLIKSELQKEGSSVIFLSELKSSSASAED